MKRFRFRWTVGLSLILIMLSGCGIPWTHSDRTISGQITSGWTKPQTSSSPRGVSAQSSVFDTNPLVFGRTTEAGENDYRCKPQPVQYIQRLNQLEATARQYAAAGYSSYRAGRLEEAIVRYEKAVEAAPATDRYYISLGSLAYRQRRFRHAKLYYCRAISLKPQNAQVSFYLGLTYVRLNRFRLAEEWLRRAVRLDPKLETARSVLRRLRYRMESATG